MKYIILIITAGLFVLSGCSGKQTFSTAVRAGDTVSHTVGMQTGVSRDNLTITFTPTTGGASISYLPGDSAIRAVVNLYPDPVSRIIVGGETGQDLGHSQTFITQPWKIPWRTSPRIGGVPWSCSMSRLRSR